MKASPPPGNTSQPTTRTVHLSLLHLFAVEQVVVEGNVAFTLEQAFVGVLVEEVPVDLVDVRGTRARQRPVAYEEVRPGAGTGERACLLAEGVVADDRRPVDGMPVAVLRLSWCLNWAL